MYVELAQKYLLKAKSTTGGTRQYFANLCQVCLAKAGAGPEAIGVSPKELAALQSKQDSKKPRQRRDKTDKDQQIEECRQYLEQGRKAKGASRQYYANLCETKLGKYAIKAEELGCTMQELSEMKRQGLLESAIKYLEDARNAQGARQKCYADLCVDYLKKANASPPDIGSSDEELNNLAS